MRWISELVDNYPNVAACVFLVLMGATLFLIGKKPPDKGAHT